ncbi:MULTISPECIES: pyridoxal 5'-phosphate synthase glutaminase subunit PdxT [Parafrankia]|uniref:Pyridoxal 5'-phosphate synthase subunit PdxT n=1 Tax=Parafrankia soli TaxID=2599596 RepID=A0A1S1QV79_9ACTN|nr:MULTISPECIES: pyridoxal 5'-phosphate synthase glutaminase subunit PdxT [Parafrankia]OHV37341.1 glutamine amidotransferase subunit PdxT [Parafrankia soli]TCJ36190.1 pyridoxal 5'-phosphate synthase glutaminase subunit PdxT [Parafrankia sp. BMG5.11]CAI7977906.1 glutamine amidotransferase for pyridoxal phosphate synthesis; pyridoxal 5'-phosphate synthase complex, glutamine amidotransferase subunit PdxT [Frankia sp. Hr75.2]
MSVPRIGVLALQGDVREHVRALREAGADAGEVRRAGELAELDGLVLPGGESTTIGRLLRVFDLLEPLRAAVAGGLPVFGSCAGMILLAQDVIDGRPGQPLIGGLDVVVRRNAFGRQVESFETDLVVDGVDGPAVHAVFIRAPWVEKAGDGVEVLARVADRPVAVRQGPLLATSFHPELTGDIRVHRLFVEIVRSELGLKRGRS